MAQVPESGQDGESRLDFESKKQETRMAVWRLLRYAVSDANKDLTKEKPGLIRKAIPVLQKPADQLDENDIAELLVTYNDLSQLVSPATNESLWLKEKLELNERDEILGNPRDTSVDNVKVKVKSGYTSYKVILWAFVLVFMLLQAYIYVISENLKGVVEQQAALASIDQQLDAAKKAVVGYEPDKNDAKYPFSDLLGKREVVWLKLNNSYCVIENISFGWGRLYIQGGGNAINCGSGTRKGDEKVEDAARASLFGGANAFLRASNYVLLPTLLGLLGALAYVIRGVLDSFSKSSFVLGAKRRWGMRVALGPLLGLISGIVVLPDIEDFKGISLSPLVWAFLMGYSVEFAFSLFDTLIDKGRNALGAMTPKAPESPGGDTAVPRIDALSPSGGSAAGGTVVAITGTGFTSDATVNFGAKPARSVTVVGDTRITAISAPGEGKVNVSVANRNAVSPAGIACEFTYVGDDEEEAHACDANVAIENATPDDELPAAEGGVT